MWGAVGFSGVAMDYDVIGAALAVVGVLIWIGWAVVVRLVGPAVVNGLTMNPRLCGRFVTVREQRMGRGRGRVVATDGDVKLAVGCDYGLTHEAQCELVLAAWIRRCGEPFTTRHGARIRYTNVEAGATVTPIPPIPGDDATCYIVALNDPHLEYVDGA